MIFQFLFRMVDTFGQKCIGGVCHHDADGFHGTESQAPGEDVGLIAESLDGGKHLVSCLLSHLVALIEDSGDSGDGDASVCGHIINIHLIVVIINFHKFFPGKALHDLMILQNQMRGTRVLFFTAMKCSQRVCFNAHEDFHRELISLSMIVAHLQSIYFTVWNWGSMGQ